MIYYLLVFCSSCFLSIFIIFLQKPFFSLATNTLALLDVLIESEQDDFVKQKKLIKALSIQLKSLSIFILFILLALSTAFLPIFLFSKLTHQELNILDFNSYLFYTFFLFGSIFPFILYSFLKKDQGHYSEWSKLLHRLILNNYNISKSLFNLNSGIYLRRKIKTDLFLVITGLARAGTTALTTKLFETGYFHSLDYSNMPFLLAPNIWKLLYKPKNPNLMERSHGDKVLFGYDTVEALEESFFKVFLNDSFIGKKFLIEHEIPESVYEKYMNYQALLNMSDNAQSVYLAKNNNLILRYNSLRRYNSEFVAVFLFRNPVEHAFSLYNQHNRYLHMQEKDRFILEYMNWLGHHEFGIGHKPFYFSNSDSNINFNTSKIEYWIDIWINYYSKILHIEDNNTYIVDYDDFLNHPTELITFIGNNLRLKFPITDINKFQNPNKFNGNIDPVFYKKANVIYDKLRQKKVKIS